MSPILVERAADLANLMVNDLVITTGYKSCVVSLDQEIARDISTIAAQWLFTRCLSLAALGPSDIANALEPVLIKAQARTFHIRMATRGYGGMQLDSVVAAIVRKSNIPPTEANRQETKFARSRRQLKRMMLSDRQLLGDLEACLHAADQKVVAEAKALFVDFCGRNSLDLRGIGAKAVERAFAVYYQEAHPNGRFIKFADPPDTASDGARAILLVAPLVTAIFNPPWIVIAICSILFFLAWIVRRESESWFARWVGGVLFTFLAIGGGWFLHEFIRRKF